MWQRGLQVYLLNINYNCGYKFLVTFSKNTNKIQLNYSCLIIAIYVEKINEFFLNLKYFLFRFYCIVIFIS